MELENNDETWEMLHLASGTYTAGTPYPQVQFDFYIKNVSDRNLYCSNEGIEKQIKHCLGVNPDRQKVVYFYYKRNMI